MINSGATTLSITTLRVKELFATFRIMTLSMTTLSIKGLFATFCITTFSIMSLSITMLYHYAECCILFITSWVYPALPGSLY
jgi:hypothetical protein